MIIKFSKLRMLINKFELQFWKETWKLSVILTEITTKVK